MPKSNGKGRGKGRGRGRGRGETLHNNNNEVPVNPGRTRHVEPSKPAVEPVEEKTQKQATPEVKRTKPDGQQLTSQQNSTSSLLSSPKEAETPSMFGTYYYCFVSSSVKI